MAGILRFALVVLMAIGSAVFIYGMVHMGWFKNLVVYRHGRPQPVRATHNVRRAAKIAANVAKLAELLRKP